MSETNLDSPEKQQKIELTAGQQEQVEKLGSAFHEDWRLTRKNEDGSFEPRIKSTTDSVWIEARGTDQVDIANTDFAELPQDWKAENADAAEVIVRIASRYPEGMAGVDLADIDTVLALGDEIHSEWLGRPNNSYAKGGVLDVPFIDLPPAEQDKDIDQLRRAKDILQSVSV